VTGPHKYYPPRVLVEGKKYRNAPLQGVNIVTSLDQITILYAYMVHDIRYVILSSVVPCTDVFMEGVDRVKFI